MLAFQLQFCYYDRRQKLVLNFYTIHKDGGVKMSSTAQSLASKRIASLLDENSFVEIGGMVTARSTDFNMQT